MKTIAQYAGYNETHAFFHSKNEVNPFPDTLFIDIPRKEWEELGRPMNITVTVVAGKIE